MMMTIVMLLLMSMLMVLTSPSPLANCQGNDIVYVPLVMMKVMKVMKLFIQRKGIQYGF